MSNPDQVSKSKSKGKTVADDDTEEPKSRRRRKGKTVADDETEEPKSRRRKGKSVAETLAEWTDYNEKEKPVRKVQAKGSKKGCMEGKGGPENANWSYRGVRQRAWGNWVAEIREPDKKKRLWIGTFSSAVEAARAYDKAAKAMYGPAARLNFPDEISTQEHTGVSSVADGSTNSGEFEVSYDDFFGDEADDNTIRFEDVPHIAENENASSTNSGEFDEVSYDDLFGHEADANTIRSEDVSHIAENAGSGKVDRSNEVDTKGLNEELCSDEVGTASLFDTMPMYNVDEQHLPDSAQQDDYFDWDWEKDFPTLDSSPENTSGGSQPGQVGFSDTSSPGPSGQ